MELSTFTRVRRDTYTLSKEEVLQALLDFIEKDAGVRPSRENVMVDAFGRRPEGMAALRPGAFKLLNDVDKIAITVDWGG